MKALHATNPIRAIRTAPYRSAEQSTRQLGQRVCNEERGDDQSTLGVVEIELLTEQGESRG